jgi:hypothetical protein
MAQDMGLITDTWMTNPYMFDPTQLSNAYSNYNNAALPWPPSYNTGAGGPVNAATGQPIQSFQNWQQQNPGGMSINATPAQPPTTPLSTPNTGFQMGPMYPGGPSVNQNPNYSSLAPSGWSGNSVTNPDKGSFGGWTPAYSPQQPAQPQQDAPQAAPQASAPPNNWQAAINALANPGRVQTMGANVPMVQGYQPSGGINAAFLQNAQGRPNMNQGFLSALAALQNRPGQ